MARVLLDTFYHSPPTTGIGGLIAGAFAVNTGRYSPNDFAHPNGLSHLAAAMAADGHELRPLHEPYTDDSLADADILISANPDYPGYAGSSPYRWTPAAVDALERFVRRGGGVLLLVNSFLSRPDFWEENFDLERVTLLFERLGVRWDPNYMSSADIIEPARAGGRIIGYGQGGRVLGPLPDGVEPILTYEGMVYGFRARLGTGSIVVMGDAGLISNGLVNFPGFDNLAFLRQLIGDLAPAWEHGWNGRWLASRAGNVSGGPTIEMQPLFRRLRPDAEWIETYHYRNLVWENRSLVSLDDVLATLPVGLETARTAGRITASLTWQRIDSTTPGPVVPVDLVTRTSRSGDVEDITISGRTESMTLHWPDLCSLPEWIDRPSRLARVSLVFEERLTVLAGRLRAARWHQGQLAYAHDASAAHYGYEIVVSSEQAVFAPSA
jgi:hypothetical protein